MKRTRPSYLQTYRLSHGLTWAELGGLLGVSEASVRKYDTGERVVSASALIALELIFGQKAVDLFPALYGRVGNALMDRSFALRECLAGRGDPTSQKKLDLLHELETRVLNAHIL
ncbi:MAG TPA: helix-turn-helix transcriptional regulator [Rhizomicrobium sp.]|nr:helix-turn-helix transcriptional regulator [Rhizomicrobium sp.]